VDDDSDVIGIVEGCRAAPKRGVVEVPFWRSKLPDESGKITPIFVVAVAAAISGEVKLVPPLQLGLGQQRHLA
jgi:hypothetical protein